ncbi:MAG: hypothetical protein M1837_005152 [Sclerophora amabilis]|nr:MAG: hypothetical protein M1837_005152 [Sclerophora amabilis]
MVRGTPPASPPTRARQSEFHPHSPSDASHFEGRPLFAAPPDRPEPRTPSLDSVTPHPLRTPQNSVNPVSSDQSESSSRQLAQASNFHANWNRDPLGGPVAQSRRPSRPGPSSPPSKASGSQTHYFSRYTVQPRPLHPLAGDQRKGRPYLPFDRQPPPSMHPPKSPSGGPTSPLSRPVDSSMLPPSARTQPRDRAALKLADLPRFHPAKFQLSSNPNSASSTPAGPSNSQPPTPQRQHNRRSSDAQRQLQNYQRELVASATRVGRNSSSSIRRPVSPRLNPLGSPGPVTPLALEKEDGGYLTAGMSPNGRKSLGEGGGTERHAELVERLIEEQARLRQSPTETIAAVGGNR